MSSFEGEFSYVVAILSKKIIHYAMMFLPFPNKKVIYNFSNTLLEEELDNVTYLDYLHFISNISVSYFEKETCPMTVALKGYS